MTTTKRRDFRSFDQATQAELRRMVFVNLDKSKGRQVLADMVEVNIQTINDWVRKRTSLMGRDFHGEVRGRILGDKRILTEEEEKDIKDSLVSYTPEELSLGSALWTRRKV